MNTEVILSILGVIGTLLGTILGWGLNALSQKGKIFLYVKKQNENYQKQDSYGGLNDCDYNDAEYYNYKLSLDVYNSSRETRIMRNITFSYYSGKQKLFSIEPKDDSTKHSGGSPLVFYDEVAVINIPARSAVNINLHNGLNNHDVEWKLLKDSSRIVLEYLDEKDKRKTAVLLKRN